MTDAHVVLGHLPARLLGGRMALDVEAARARRRRASPRRSGFDCEAAARGILAIVDNNMVGAMRVVSVERGHDPRDFTLVPFGGAGPLHGCALADLLGITRVLIPPAPGVLCADGLLAADLKAEFSRTLPKAGRSRSTPGSRSSSNCTPGRRMAVGEKAAPEDRGKRRVALMRYHGQGGEIAVAGATTRGRRGGVHRRPSGPLRLQSRIRRSSS